jgi:hypothetical protein
MNPTKEEYAVDFTQLKTVSQLSSKITKIVPPEEIIRLADEGYITSFRIATPKGHIASDEYLFMQPLLQTEIQERLLVETKAPEILHLHTGDNRTFNVPEELGQMIPAIYEMDISYPPAVYFLVKDNKVVYIGQSIRLASRISQHWQEKDFDRILYIPVPKEKLNVIEGALINHFKPELNSTVPKLYNEYLKEVLLS